MSDPPPPNPESNLPTRRLARCRGCLPIVAIVAAGAVLFIAIALAYLSSYNPDSQAGGPANEKRTRLPEEESQKVVERSEGGSLGSDRDANVKGEGEMEAILIMVVVAALLIFIIFIASPFCKSTGGGFLSHLERYLDNED